MYINKYKQNKYIIIVCLLFLFLSCSNKSSDTLLNDLAQIDYNYAYSLLIVKNIDRETSTTVISNFIKDWALFRNQYINMNEEDFYWKNDISTISDLLIRINYFITADEDISAAYPILHDIKYVLSDMRKRNNINWAMDYLSAIYKTAYRLNELSKEYSEKKNISYDEERRIISVYITLDNNSKKLSEEMPKGIFELYQFTETAKQTLNKEIQDMDKLVVELGIYFTNYNYTEIYQSTEKILEIYFNIMTLYASYAKKFK